MDTLHLPVTNRLRRRYSLAFKNDLIDACRQPGASTTAIAVANGINPNLVRKWIRLRDASTETRLINQPQAPALVPVQIIGSLPEPDACSSAEPIRLELQRGAVRLSVTWPAAHMEAYTRWLREFCA